MKPIQRLAKVHNNSEQTQMKQNYPLQTLSMTLG